MTMLLRLLGVIIRAWGKRLANPLAESDIPVLVWPNDIDLNFHLNNGRYLSAMDLGRFDLLIRLGLGRTVIKNRWRPMLGGATIRFLGPLAPLARYRLLTRLVWWDEKWFYFEQRFVNHGRVVAVALVRGLLRGREGNISIDRMLAEVGLRVDRPEQPPEVTAWIDWLDRMIPAVTQQG